MHLNLVKIVVVFLVLISNFGCESYKSEFDRAIDALEDAVNQIDRFRGDVDKHVQILDTLARDYPDILGSELRKTAKVVVGVTSGNTNCVIDNVAGKVHDIVAIDLNNLIRHLKFQEPLVRAYKQVICQASHDQAIYLVEVASGALKDITLYGYNLAYFTKDDITFVIEQNGNLCKVSELLTYSSDYSLSVSLPKDLMLGLSNSARVGLVFLPDNYNLPQCSSSVISAPDNFSYDYFWRVIPIPPSPRPVVLDKKYGRVMGPNPHGNLHIIKVPAYDYLSEVGVSLTAGGIDLLRLEYDSTPPSYQELASNDKADWGRGDEYRIPLKGKIPLGFEMHGHSDWVDRIKIFYWDPDSKAMHASSCYGRDMGSFRFYSAAPEGYELVGFNYLRGSALTGLSGVYRQLPLVKQSDELEDARHALIDSMKIRNTHGHKIKNVDLDSYSETPEKAIKFVTEDGVRDQKCDDGTLP